MELRGDHVVLRLLAEEDVDPEVVWHDGVLIDLLARNSPERACVYQSQAL